ncbi:response regulator [Rhodococcus sp. HM1]|uniref:response regulator n=1 Tax=Rhodococcus sp. HM1 TaxID=2937759 RepID=UPI00200B40A7|nr:response regulator [Rhodococcus sp. HM1]MCK8671032.1 response regulator [Rhodococcus sp. HM1]
MQDKRRSSTLEAELPSSGWTAERMFAGPGDARERHRNTDWSATALGPVETWPMELRMAVNTVLPSEVPMLVWWGPELIQIFNDAFVPILGDKYPAAVGQRGADCWREIWDAVGSLAEEAWAGRATFTENERLFLQRHGFVEESYWTFSYSPIFDDTGAVAGVFVATADTTAAVFGDRRREAISRLGTVAISDAGNSVADICEKALAALALSGADVPVAAVYLDSRTEHPERAVPHTWDRVADLGTIGDVDGLLGPDAQRVLDEVARSREPLVVTGVAERSPGVVDPTRLLGAQPFDTVVLLPLTVPARATAIGVLAVGLNPNLAYDDNYAALVQLIAARISGLLRDSLAFDAERRRADALAEVDKAKTRFLETVSHEFRTPLVLLLGPLQSVLDDADALTDEQHESLETARRAVMRLQRLVDVLLEATRAESYKVRPRLQPTDAAALTAACVELYEPIVRDAGLTLVTRIDDAAAETIALDPEIWSHIVFNLLSNAVKYTLDGSITVELGIDGDRLVLSVTDTGVGIPPDEATRVFERFHRVEGAAGRTAEGVGLGLSLVSDWVQALGGTVAVTSAPGAGSTFTVSVPRVVSSEKPVAAEGVPASMGGSYLAESAQWVNEPTDAPVADAAGGRPRILVIDDNADLRNYLTSLLGQQDWRVDAVADVATALKHIQDSPPHLVLSDVMLPGPDGLALLKQLRNDPATARLPVILLTARAGTSAAVGGLQDGADDYITKPFEPDELIARVRVNLELSRLREEIIALKERESGQLRSALESRTTLSEAVGLIMATFRCDADTAFEKLVAFSQHRNVKLRVIAQEIVEAHTSSVREGG